MYPFYYYFDPTYILVLIGAIISMIASGMVQSAYSKYSQVRCMAGLTGGEAANAILRNNGITDVRVECIRGNALTNYYHPSKGVICLSESVYHSQSISALGIAAHECGHAIQYQQNYFPVRVKNALSPAASFGSKAGIPIILLGILFGYNATLVNIGIWVFAIAVFVQLVTLPVEFNASSRALVCLEQYGMVTHEEKKGSAKVLRAAALTYVAAAAAAILQLLRLIILFGGRRRDD